MKKADLHVHSKFSAHPSEWFLQRIGTRESYTEPDFIYQQAKALGMDFVTITDHNCLDASLYLREKYPLDTFTGCEVTTYFPEDGCKIHVVVWDITERQFAMIQKIRQDIYALRDYIKEEHIVHGVAHATFSINKKMNLENFEKLILLFDTFEAINGTRTKISNDVLFFALQELTPVVMTELYAKYRIEPFSETPWHKGFYGGSDDHSALFIAKTYTAVEKDAVTPQDFLQHVRDKETFAGGRHNDYIGFAASLYKIAYEFSKSNKNGISSMLMETINRVLFEKKKLDFKSRMSLKKIELFGNSPLTPYLLDFIKTFRELQDSHMEDKLSVVYEHLTKISDELVRSVLDSISGSLKGGDISKLVKNVATLIPTAFISAPFFSTINILNDSRELLEQLRYKYENVPALNRKKILWFTDTISDLNGVSETIRKLGWISYKRGLDLQIVYCDPGDSREAEMLPPSAIALPQVAQHTPSAFNTYTLRIPSMLAAIKMISEAQPHEILISTPGPVGWIGMIMAKLLHIPCRAIYHTDFTAYTQRIIKDEVIAGAVQAYVQWFYSFCDTVYVPTFEYMEILEKRGYNRTKMVRFKRGIDRTLFNPVSESRQTLSDAFGVKQGINLLYAGRISKEKNIGTLFTMYESLREKYTDLNLVLCGDGPDFESYKKQYQSSDRIYFLGRIAREKLPKLYSAADCFVFPSLTDTFGMVVLEAQACGLPVVVSASGGPSEIIRDGVTGLVVEGNSVQSWEEKVEEIVKMINSEPDKYLQMRYEAVRHVERNYNWDDVLSLIFGTRTIFPKTKTPWNQKDLREPGEVIHT